MKANELWKQGNLEWKLTSIQKKMKKEILEETDMVSVSLCSRRIGRTYLLCVIAIETCLADPDSVVKILVPRTKSIKYLIKPIIRKICEDGKEFEPVYLTADKVFKFSNGSEIHLAGSDNGNSEDLRGGSADLIIVDSASFCSDLTYCLRSILIPTVKQGKGKIIVSDCLPMNKSSEFMCDWVLPKALSLKLKKYTIYDSDLSKEEIREIKDSMEPKEFKIECELSYE